MSLPAKHRGAHRGGRNRLGLLRLLPLEKTGLVERADAYVTLTATEGWGLGAFDAATRGVPLVITGWGGQREWLGDDAPWVVPYTMEPADHPDRTMFEPGMEWARADVDAAVEMLRAIHADRSAARAAAAPMAPPGFGAPRSAGRR